MRAGMYLRISQDRTGEGLGVERQRDACQQLINRRGWTLAQTFPENDTSAAGRKPRPQFQAMLKAAQNGEIDVIVAWAMDRLARRARDRLALVEVCQNNGVIIALHQGTDMDPTTSSGRLVIGVLGEAAQFEIDLKSERQESALEQAAEAGRWSGGRKPFGYAPDGVTVLDDEAAAIREGYAALLAGVSLRAIAEAWNAAGFTTGQAPWKHLERGVLSPWRADSVRRVLANPRYCGIRALRRKGYRREYGRAQWPPLVGEETFRAAVRLLADPGRRTGGAGASGRQLLTGVALCGVPGCGFTVHGGGGKHGKPIYRCGSEHLLAAQKTGRAPGTHVNRLAAPVDVYIERLVIRQLSRPEAHTLLAADDALDIDALRSRAQTLRLRLEQMAAEFGADASLQPGEYRAMRQPVACDLADVEGQLAEAGRTSVLAELVTADDVEAAWSAPGFGIDRQRTVIDAMLAIRLHAIGRGVRTFRPETVEYVWRKTLD